MRRQHHGRKLARAETSDDDDVGEMDAVLGELGADQRQAERQRLEKMPLPANPDSHAGPMGHILHRFHASWTGR